MSGLIEGGLEIFDIPANKMYSDMHRTYTSRSKYKSASTESWSKTLFDIVAAPYKSLYNPSMLAALVRTINGKPETVAGDDVISHIAGTLAKDSVFSWIPNDYLETRLKLDGQEQSYFKSDEKWYNKVFSMMILGDYLRGNGLDEVVPMTLLKMSRIAQEYEKDSAIAKGFQGVLYDTKRIKERVSIKRQGQKDFPVTLTPEEASVYNQKFLATNNKALENLFRSNEFKNASFVEQEEKIKKVAAATMRMIHREIRQLPNWQKLVDATFKERSELHEKKQQEMQVEGVR